LPLADAFKRREKGELGSGKSSDLIHRFHQGPARELFARHDTPYLVASAAYAVAVGIVERICPASSSSTLPA